MMSVHQATGEKSPNDEASVAAEDVSKTVYGQPVIVNDSVIMGQPATSTYNQAASTLPSISAKKYQTAEP